MPTAEELMSRLSSAVQSLQAAQIAVVQGANQIGNAAHRTGDETLSGKKTFTESPILPTPEVGDNSGRGATTAFVAVACAMMTGASANAAGTKGIVPAPAKGDQAKFLRADATWQVPYTHPTTSGNKHIPAGGSAGQILRWSADGTAVWGADNNTTYDVVTTSVNGLMSSSDKSKLDGIAAGAQVNTITGVKGSAESSYRTGNVNLTAANVGAAASNHAHGNITNDGKLGSTAAIPLITGTNGVIQAGSFGSTAGTFCQGNDVRLSDSRTPTAHNHAASNITSGVFEAARIPSLDASKITTGTIDIDRLPAGALERLVIVSNQSARFALTTSNVQLGDTVKQSDTGQMYFVKDTSKLNSENGYEPYTAGSAASVPWSGVTGKPSSFYTHPSYTSKSSGLYKITVDATGHVSAVTAVAKSDITALGIPGSDTVYTLPTASSSTLGGVKTTSTVTSASGYTACPIISGVPYYKDTNTPYTHPSHTAYTSGLYKITVNNLGHITAATAVAKSDITALGIPGSDTVYTLPTASSSTLGGVKTTSTVTSASGYTACPIISGVPYYKDTDTNTDTKVNVTLDKTHKAYLLGVTNTPTSTAAAREAVADTGVFLDETAGSLTATKVNVNTIFVDDKIDSDGSELVFNSDGSIYVNAANLTFPTGCSLFLTNTHDGGISNTDRTYEPAIVIGNTSGNRIEIDNNEISALTVNTDNSRTANTLYLNHDGGPVSVGSTSSTVNTVFNVYGDAVLKNTAPSLDFHLNTAVKGTPPTGSDLSGGMAVRDKNGTILSRLHTIVYKAGDNHDAGEVSSSLMAYNFTSTATSDYATLAVVCKMDGTKYATAPTPASVTENNNKIATTKWVRDATGTFACTASMANQIKCKNEIVKAYILGVPGNSTGYQTPSFNTGVYLDTVGGTINCVGVGANAVTIEPANANAGPGNGLTIEAKGSWQTNIQSTKQNIKVSPTNTTTIIDNYGILDTNGLRLLALCSNYALSSDNKISKSATLYNYWYTGTGDTVDYHKIALVREVTDAKTHFVVEADKIIGYINSGTNHPASGARTDLGDSTHSFKDIYTKSGQNQLSDEREKTEIADFSDEFLDAWGDIEFKQYRMIDDVEEKGAKARIHNGIVAQQALRKLDAKGIDHSRYGFYCHSKWDAKPAVIGEDGKVEEEAIEAGDIYSIRYAEALCIEAAYQRRRADRLEAKVADLERRLLALESKNA